MKHNTQKVGTKPPHNHKGSKPVVPSAAQLAKDKRTILIKGVVFDFVTDKKDEDLKINEMRMANLKYGLEEFGEIEEFRHPIRGHGDAGNGIATCVYKEEDSVQEAVEAFRDRYKIKEMFSWMRKEVDEAQEPFGTMPKYHMYHVKSLIQKQGGAVPQQYHEPKKYVPEKKAESVSSLQEEMEKMKISRDLQYVTEQHHKVSAELQYHQKRVRARDDRVKQLEQELAMIKMQQKRVEEQLAEERTWKKSAVTSMETLRLELKSLEDQKRGLDTGRKSK